ncbi:YigZ family protein [Marinobacterium aestuariivivens]|uniref:YigZ family protein n=1 Tax=Marinobacterium aestuariivivens TaxID=1698799 RepID=A0ABW2A8E3_9GAMM
MAEPFDRPASARSVEIEIKNSRFICHVAPTAGIEAAQAFVGRIRREHPDANHNCWCYVAGDPQDYNQWNCSDDGEPRGTAGKPMLNVLTHSGLGEICVVVTRYFGGIKLGAGGLVRAYSQAVQTGLDHLPTEAVIETFAVSLSAPTP